MPVFSFQEAYCEYLRTINYISHALLEEAGMQSKIRLVCGDVLYDKLALPDCFFCYS